MTDNQIQTCINILKEAKGSSDDFKRARLTDCYNDLKGLLENDARQWRLVGISGGLKPMPK